MHYQTSYQSPLGYLIIESNGEAITKIDFAEKDISGQQKLEVLEDCKVQLQEYFEGKRLIFDLPLKPEGTEFQQKVWNELLKIPFGVTQTYHELAVKLGNPKVIRAAGTANGRNPIAIIIPCHRVIGTGNKLTGYAGGIWRKRMLLEHEIKYNPTKQTLF
jgi:methylated-DNA-[protein]-cysteine S-methyltransferase